MKGLGAKVLGESFVRNVLGESFGRNVLGESFFFGTTSCIWGWVLGRVKGLGWPGLGWGLGGVLEGWAGLGWGWAEPRRAGLACGVGGWDGLGWAGV